MGTASNERLLKRSFFFLCAVAVFIYVLNVSMVGAPLFGSDEYAYFISGKYADDLTRIRDLDPWLQRIPNVVLFAFFHALFKLTDNDFVTLVRVVHIAEYLATLGLLYKSFEQFCDEWQLRAGVLLLMLLPSTIYLYTTMPESELVFATAILTYIVLVVFPRRPRSAAIAAGVVAGLAILVKPHAIASLLATLLFVLLAPVFPGKRGRWPAALVGAALFLIASLATVVFAWRLCTGTWSFSPSVILGFGLYGGSLQVEGGASLARSKGVAAIGYAAAHLAVLSLVFAPGMVLAVSRMFRRVEAGALDADPGVARAEAQAAGSWFIVLMLLTHVAMTAWFSAGVAQASEGESMRLHGRYLGPALILLVVIQIQAIFQAGRLEIRATRGLAVVALFACLSVVLPQFKVFPWDYPMLFGFFRAPNHYSWDYPGSLAVVGTTLVGLHIVAMLVMLWSESLFRWALVFLSFAVMIAGDLQTYDWAYLRGKSNVPLVAATEAIQLLIANEKGGGLVVSDNRYGDTSTILFHLAEAPRVLIKESGSTISAADVGDASWVLFANSFSPAFDYVQKVAFGPFQLFPRHAGVAVEEPARTLLEHGQSRRLLLGTGLYPPGNLPGFNQQEPWGSWSAGKEAVILLPFKVRGPVRIRFFGWTLPENLHPALVLKIGNAAREVQLTTVGAEYEFMLNVDADADRIVVQSPISRPGGTRWLGTAISYVLIEAQ